MVIVCRRPRLPSNGRAAAHTARAPALRWRHVWLRSAAHSPLPWTRYPSAAAVSPQRALEGHRDEVVVFPVFVIECCSFALTICCACFFALHVVVAERIHCFHRMASEGASKRSRKESSSLSLAPHTSPSSSATAVGQARHDLPRRLAAISFVELPLLPVTVLREAITAWAARHPGLDHVSPEALTECLEWLRDRPVPPALPSPSRIERVSGPRLRVSISHAGRARVGGHASPICYH